MTSHTYVNKQGIKMHPFEQFLEHFTPVFEKKFTNLNKASWILETTGSQDAADLRADLDTELKLLFSDPKVYHNLQEWDRDSTLQDPLLKRQLNVLLRSFKQNQAPQALLEEIAKKEAAFSVSYASFRATLHGKPVTENDIKDILKKETNVGNRQKAWEASKQIGEVAAPQILELVRLRNRLAKHLGYHDFFQMQLDLQEVDRTWLLQTFDDLDRKSASLYDTVIQEIQTALSQRFHVAKKELGPWSFSEPFSQEDPLDSEELDTLVANLDIVTACRLFYEKMGMDVAPILQRSDMFEREGKCQHAFCMHVDRRGDIRTLNNVKSSMRWLETVLHELGHAVYDLYIDPALPWILREPPHMIPTEAMALLAGRQAFRKESLKTLLGDAPEKLLAKAERSLMRRQLIFSRWVFVMTFFESELYRNPDQDLSALWWSLVEKYQKIPRPANRESQCDWATKYHMGLAPVYYFSYLLGETFASAIQEAFQRECGPVPFASPATGRFLRDRLFAPGDRMSWDALVQFVTGERLNPEAWVNEFKG